MFDPQLLSTVVEKQIHDIVENQINDVLSNPIWAAQMEQRIIGYMQDRILARYQKLGSTPELMQAVRDSVKKLLDDGHMPGLADCVDQDVLKSTINNTVQLTIKKILDELMIDPVWVDKIEKMTAANAVSTVTNHLSFIDINSVIAQQVDKNLEKWYQQVSENLQTKGISDQATETNLTIMDGVVVVEQETVTRDLSVENSATIKGALTVQDLVVTGLINTDNSSWNELSDSAAQKTLEKLDTYWKQELVKEVLDLARTQGIDFSQINLCGEPLISGDTLNSTIVKSNLQQLGVLDSLTVNGTSWFNETLKVTRNRVGINTETPEMALGIWDEEISLVLGKRQKDQAFIGTGRKQSLAIGVNREPSLEISVDGLITVKQLRVGQHRISHSSSVPGHSGTKGDWVFNTNPRPGQPFAWVCLGGFNWQGLLSA